MSFDREKWRVELHKSVHEDVSAEDSVFEAQESRTLALLERAYDEGRAARDAEYLPMIDDLYAKWVDDTRNHRGTTAGMADRIHAMRAIAAARKEEGT